MPSEPLGDDSHYHAPRFLILRQHEQPGGHDSGVPGGPDSYGLALGLALLDAIGKD